MSLGFRFGFLKALGRFAKAESGVVAIEFAMVALPFFTLLLVILETGILMFVEYTLQASVQEASRLVRTGQAQSSSYNAADFKTQICRTASIVIDCTGGVTVYVDADTSFANLKAKMPSFTNVGPKVDNTANPTSFVCGGPLMTTLVIASFDWKLITPGMYFMGNFNNNTVRRMVGFAMFQNEPFPDVASCKVT